MSFVFYNEELCIKKRDCVLKTRSFAFKLIVLQTWSAVMFPPPPPPPPPMPCDPPVACIPKGKPITFTLVTHAHELWRDFRLFFD